MIERTLRISRLFDIYGPLLTDRQRELIELHYGQDLSLGEIADQDGISRQAVHDQLTRAEKALAGYEERLQLLARRQRESERLKAVRAAIAAGDSAAALKALGELIDD
jgi:predicted DNA-binding protein YlxM (UPF0122 family)